MPHATPKIASLLLFLPCLALVSGCNTSIHEDGAKPYPDLEVFTEPAVGELGYPSGPYGANKGSIISNYAFQGFKDPSADSETLTDISLGDFYNPTGEEVYPEGSPYGAGKPRPKVLLIDVSSSWCAPCQYEASEVLPGKYASQAPRGAQFLLQLADGPTPGVAAELKDLRAWTNKFDVNFPSAIDPSYQLGALFDASAFPANFIIRTRTMEIVERVTGSPDESFWDRVESLLDEEQ